MSLRNAGVKGRVSALLSPVGDAGMHRAIWTLVFVTVAFSGAMGALFITGLVLIWVVPYPYPELVLVAAAVGCLGLPFSALLARHAIAAVRRGRTLLGLGALLLVIVQTFLVVRLFWLIFA